MKKELNFKEYSALANRLVVNPISKTMLHQMYVDWKVSLRHYKTTATEDIIMFFEDWTFDTHGNCLKRDLTK